MKALLEISVCLFFISASSSCQTTNRKDKIIFEKNKCYNVKLKELKTTSLYQYVMAAFRDTFLVLRTQKEYFGVPDVVTNQIDEGVFFKKDSSECMLIVLQKSKPPDYVFGRARMVRGYYKNNKWVFKVSMSFYFEKDYFELFADNNFENISKLARYNVLTEGNIRKSGCEIDDQLWFEQLKN